MCAQAIQLSQKEVAIETEQRVTSYMSHELRNPLFGLTGCLEVCYICILYCGASSPLRKCLPPQASKKLFPLA